ncbi:hypothetical protein NKK48_30310 [Mesorhizobium sp. C386A]|uniref:hypothetical protein n=1 Tax=Mesorhizobium sp. C386A TaxID=2956831 RepID=UPI0033352E76
MRAKSFTLDGKRHKIHPQIPLQEIRWLVGRQHVGEPDTTIEALFDERAKTGPRRPSPRQRSSPSGAIAGTRSS